MANGAGQPTRAEAATPDLDSVAREIVLDPSLRSIGLREAAIEMAIFRLGRAGSPYVAIVEALFRISDDEKALPQLKDRKQRASKKAGKAIDEGYLQRVCRALADAMLQAATEKREAAGSPQPPVEPPAITAPSRRDQFRRRALLVAALVGAALVAACLVLFVGKSGRGSAAEPSLQQLKLASFRHLTHQEVMTLEKGRLGGVLGFGNAAPGGGRTFHYKKNNHIGFLTQYAPIFDAVVNLNEGIGDERRFLRVKATTVSDARQLEPFTANDRAALARPHEVLWTTVRIDNNAAPEPGCKLTGPSVARDTRLRLHVWNSPSDRLHVIRGWVGAQNTKPRWITDAVAVRTTAATTLEPDGSLSREYSRLSRHYVEIPRITVEPLLSPNGLLIGGDGVVGSCWDNVFYLSIGWRQVET
jgi:hypothetical protein